MFAPVLAYSHSTHSPPQVALMGPELTGSPSGPQRTAQSASSIHGFIQHSSWATNTSRSSSPQVSILASSGGYWWQGEVRSPVQVNVVLMPYPVSWVWLMWCRCSVISVSLSFGTRPWAGVRVTAHRAAAWARRTGKVMGYLPLRWRWLP